jgi:8-oxo-dGTP pyrophosphatase MutT (NUDIX family)
MTDSVNCSALAEMRELRTAKVYAECRGVDLSAAGGPPPVRRSRPGRATMSRMEDESVVSGPWTRRTRRVAYENAWITIWHDEVIRPDGEPGIYGVVHFANRAVGVLVLDDADRVLLVGQHRYTLDLFSWEIPEGGVPAGESTLEGARRELREETGIEAADWVEIARSHLSNSVSDEEAVLYLATGLSHGVATPDGTEALAVQWVPFDVVLSMTLDGQITDALTVLAVQRAALARLSVPDLVDHELLI